MIYIITGDGKGKTTSAVGMAVRMLGYDKKVLFAQFLKGSDSGEVKILKSIDNVTVMRLSRDYGFISSRDSKNAKEVIAEHNNMLKFALENEFDMIILDEIIGTDNFELADRGLLFEVLNKNAEIVLTGRNPSGKLLERADYVSEIKKIRHPYDDGIQAREGIEY